MYSEQFEVLCNELDAISAHWQVNAKFREVLSRVENQLELSTIEQSLYDLKTSSPVAIKWRVMDHCSAVARLYAVYEHYCENILRDWLEFLTARKKFSDLPTKIINNYPKGFAHIIGMLPSTRYEQLSVDEIVSGYNAALKGDSGYNLFPECLTHHRMNLRWEELSEIYQRFGMTDIGVWLSKDREIINFFETAGKRTTDQLSAKLAELVQYRNDASHGVVSVDEILGQQQFFEFSHFIRILCSSLNDMHRSYALSLLQETGEAQKIGTVTERLRGNVIICTMKSGSISKGQTISFLADGYCVERRALSLQIDGVECERVDCSDGMELGIRLDKSIDRKKAAVLTNHAW